MMEEEDVLHPMCVDIAHIAHMRFMTSCLQLITVTVSSSFRSPTTDQLSSRTLDCHSFRGRPTLWMNMLAAELKVLGQNVTCLLWSASSARATLPYNSSCCVESCRVNGT